MNGANVTKNLPKKNYKKNKNIETKTNSNNPSQTKTAIAGADKPNHVNQTNKSKIPFVEGSLPIHVMPQAKSETIQDCSSKANHNKNKPNFDAIYNPSPQVNNESVYSELETFRKNKANNTSNIDNQFHPETAPFKINSDCNQDPLCAINNTCVPSKDMDFRGEDNDGAFSKGNDVYDASISPTKAAVANRAAYEALPEIQDKYQASTMRWREILGDTPPRLEVDFAPSSFGSSSSMSHASSLLLDLATVEDLQAFCSKAGVSMFVLAMGVLHHSLRAYSHGGYALGIAYDVRGALFHDAIGMFVNTVLVPFQAGKEGGEESLKQLHRRWTSDILPHAATPFDMIAAMGYDCNVYLAFNVGVLHEFGSSSAKQFSLENVNVDVSHRVDANFDLSVTWSESQSHDGSLEVSFLSGIGQWPGLHKRFLQVMTGLLQGDASSQTPLKSLLPGEQAQVLQWGQGAKKPILQACFHEMFEKQARQHPDNIALYDKKCTQSMTYGELERQSNKLAFELQRLGTKPNTFVGLLMGEKTFEMYVAVLGILKSGAAYVPMDAVLFPPNRIKFIVKDTEMQLLVTVANHAELVKGLQLESVEQVIVEDVLVGDVSCSGTMQLECIVQPTDCAYMIYTSGTTGKPKGVICNHIGPVNMIDFGGTFGLGEVGVDVVGCSAPLIFDVFVEVTFGSLGSGLSLSLDLKCCTILMCTPSVANVLLEDESNAHIKLLSVGGEACIQGLETKAQHFRNIYGPTECSIISSASTTSSTIGKPLPNVLCYVVHPDDGSLCPPGISGELWIGGIGVSLGYHNRPDLTVEKFIPNPFSSSGKVYKTGDRVKWNDEGELVYLGRFDHQVKVRGYRIELGEIQAELEKQSSVKGALVLVHEEKLVAFVTSDSSNTSNLEVVEANLWAALKSDECPLASYMIPWKIVVLEDFSLTPNGKIDRKSLVQTLTSILSKTSDSLALPRTSTQKFLCDLFKEVLLVNAVGIDCVFTEIGGHSLLSMQAVVKIRNHFNIHVFSMRQFIELGTARAIAEKIDEIAKESQEESSEILFSGTPPAITDVIDPFSQKESPILRLIAKAAGVACLFISIWISILPADVMIAKALALRFEANSASSYLSYTGILVASLVVSLFCLTIFTWIYCTLLRKILGLHSSTIRRSSLQYSLWYTFDRLWFVVRMIAETTIGGTIFYSWFYIAFGAKIGSNNFFEDVQVRLPFMLVTGDNVVIQAGAKLETAIIQKNGDVVIDLLALEDNVVVGPNAHIGLGGHLGSSSFVKALSVVPRGCKVQEKMTIFGYTAKKNEPSPPFCSEDGVASLFWHAASLYAIQIPHILTVLYFMGAIQALYLLSNPITSIAMLILCYPIVEALGQIIVASCVVILRYMLNGGPVQNDSTKLYSKSFLSHVLASKMYQNCTNSMGPSFVSRLVSKYIFGADTDIRCSFTPRLEEPDLTKIGNKVFGANGIQLRNSSFYPGGLVRFGTLHIGQGTMILDRSVVEPDTCIKNELLIGSITSVTKETEHSSNNLLMGVPALRLTRMTNGDQEATQITSEPWSQLLLLYLGGKYFDTIIVGLISATFYSNALIYWWIVFNTKHLQSMAFGMTLLALPIAFISLVTLLLLLCLVIKQVFIGNYKKMHSQGLMRSDSWAVFRWLISNIMIHRACGVALQLVDEFWLTAFFWKMMGAKIGKHSQIDPDVLMLEADLLEVGDNCRIENEATLLCHKFNNGGLEVEPIVLPSNTYVGPRAVIIPGSEILNENVTIQPLTPINPGEKLTAGNWRGSPAEKVDIG